MKGLLLNQYYSVRKSIVNYLLLSVVITVIILFTQNQMMLEFAALLPMIFMVIPAFEVLKHESKSGWNKFVLTLPLKRSHIVQSHYIFFSMMMVIGLLVTIVLFVIFELILGNTLTDQSVYSIMSGVGIVLILGFFTYPLTYHFGTEKSDMVLFFGIIAAIAIFYLSSLWYSMIITDTIQGINHDLVYSISFVAITLVLFIVAYVITLKVYKRKEF